MGANRDRAVTMALAWYEGIAVDRHEVDSLADYIERAIDAAVAEEVAAERETNAEMARHYFDGEQYMQAARDAGVSIAWAIRARSTVKP